MTIERLLTPAQVAAEFHISVEWLASLRKKGGGPVYLKPNRKVTFYRASDIEAWISSWPEKPAKTKIVQKVLDDDGNDTGMRFHMELPRGR